MGVGVAYLYECGCGARSERVRSEATADAVGTIHRNACHGGLPMPGERILTNAERIGFRGALAGFGWIMAGMAALYVLGSLWNTTH
ncbi:hypothetical protein [Streptomyces sp. NPDC058268]|uniref:hypothetical protein n=1 Tax=Streptomyces sp. NPDC058268 TaxID=3346413 RepID=UPI0036E7DEE6